MIGSFAVLGATSDATRNLYVLTAFGGGIISFLSPCVLPIVPGYLSLMSGLTIGELAEARSRALRRIVVNTALFVSGFTAVFVILGLVTTAAGKTLFENQVTLTRVSGGLVLLMAAYLAGSQLLTTPRLYQEFRFHPHLERFGPVATPVAGAAFGLGWTPCIGPVLGTVLNFAAQGRDVGRASVLLTAYSLGLGASFLVVGLAFGRLATPLAWVKRHSRAITLASAGLLAVFGVILLANQLPQVTARLSDAMRALGLESLVNSG
ncbi:MAG TPA: cytochrome c biogenesis protein CcdA [Acidimicrobiia bacterium]|jgi:cytochrome c-type biogenesis protein|nr:cytochrome c biogenesis protein CcdA [Acidimicrobiia bacterium]